MGVLTKADLVTGSKVAAIQDVLRGNKYPLGKGGKKWFITRQPSQQDIDRGLDLLTAAKLGDLRNQYGTKLLRRGISGSLARHIQSEYAQICRPG